MKDYSDTTSRDYSDTTSRIEDAISNFNNNFQYTLTQDGLESTRDYLSTENSFSQIEFDDIMINSLARDVGTMTNKVSNIFNDNQNDIIEKTLDKVTKKRTKELSQDVENEMRLSEISTYYKKQYQMKKHILMEVAIITIIIYALFVLKAKSILPDSIFKIFLVLILFVFIFFRLSYQIISYRFRDAYNFDEYNFSPPTNGQLVMNNSSKDKPNDNEVSIDEKVNLCDNQIIHDTSTVESDTTKLDTMKSDTINSDIYWRDYRKEYCGQAKLPDDGINNHMSCLNNVNILNDTMMCDISSESSDKIFSWEYCPYTKSNNIRLIPVDSNQEDISPKKYTKPNYCREPRNGEKIEINNIYNQPYDERIYGLCTQICNNKKLKSNCYLR